MTSHHLSPPHNTYIAGHNSSYQTPPLIPLNAEGVDEYDDASTTTSESHGEDDAWTSRPNPENHRSPPNRRV